MSKKDYYEVLGVKKNCTEVELKKAYRGLVKLHHPDKGGDEDIFKSISEAYDVLSNSEKRNNYDRFGHNTPNFGGYNGDPFSSQRGFNRGQKPVGNNMSLILKLTLEDIYNGVKKTYKYKRDIPCGSCNGIGGSELVTCNSCGGKGIKVRIYNTPMGQVQQLVTCDTCSGNGEIYSVECKSCHGSGLESSEETVNVVVPSGVFEGMVLIMEGKGHGVKGGNQGDLHIKIMELQHDYYVRNGSDLKLKLKLTYPQLILGGKVDIITIEGKNIRVTIPEYSNVGSNLRIPFKGLKDYGNDNRGDILISLDIDIPTDIDSETREIIEQLKEKLNPKVVSE